MSQAVKVLNRKWPGEAANTVGAMRSGRAEISFRAGGRYAILKHHDRTNLSVYLLRRRVIGLRDLDYGFTGRDAALRAQGVSRRHAQSWRLAVALAGPSAGRRDVERNYYRYRRSFAGILSSDRPRYPKKRIRDHHARNPVTR